ncbi:ArsR family transcriptional regulator [Halocalculus aciditolerans]|uniref:MarR family transcriptional regulator n=1 Tax=Halocalculus aciditolerans TaxID=1383812 RepID=A0A830FFY8_9EURY|nr:ArsR family transcriptional regulator [Halocalculus aciditolerans]GGL51542.1 MarR family transcriptional regulator [Halocalculus aciditolerans]
MDSGALLDILGNENRRRILRLLSRKPCYVTEISDYLGVSPKAVIDHLRRLEDAGLVESHVDDQRRKYFHIARNLRLEVTLSPYSFGAKSAYPASRSLDIEQCSHLSLDFSVGADGDVSDLAGELDALRDLERELSLAQRWVQGRVADVQEELADSLVADGNERLYADVLSALAGGADGPSDVADAVDAPVDVAERVLRTLSEDGLVERTRDGWQIAD